MAATNPGANWFLLLKVGNEAQGPMSAAELRQKAAAGLIGSETLIRKGADGQWVRAEKVQGLFQSPPTTAARRVEVKAAGRAPAPCVAKELRSPPPPLPPGTPPGPPPPPPSIPLALSGTGWKRLSRRTWLLAAGGVATAALLAGVVMLHGDNKTPDRAADAAAAVDMKSPTVPPKAGTRPAAARIPTPPPVATAGNGNGPVKPGPTESKPAPEAGGPKALDLPDLVEKVAPSVVQLNVSGPTGSATGSGFVVDKQGTIVTNYHVIQDATTGTVVFSDKTSAPITGYVGAWPEKDIALLRVECPPDRLHPLGLAASPPRQGERVAAFGSPLGLSRSVSEGIVGAVRQGKELRTLVPLEVDAILIQTTTAISHGNSGGPLVDMKGMVVGVNTLTFQPLGGENLNFAVSAVDVQPLLWGEGKNPLPLPVRDAGQSTAGEVRRVLNRALAHLDAGEFDKAVADCTEAIRLDPKNARAYNYRGFAYNGKGDYDNAIADCTEAIRLDPKNALAYSYRASAHRLKQDLDAAIADFTEAVRLDPQDADAYRCRGSAYYFRRDYDKAIADFTEAVRLDPQDAGAYRGRGSSYNDKGDYDKAIADFTEAVRLDPKYFLNALTYIDRGDAYNGKGDYDAAVADCDKAIAECTEASRLDPNFCRITRGQAFSRRGVAYAGKRDWHSAIADLTEAIRLDPKNGYFYSARGRIYNEMGQKNMANKDFAKAKALGYKP